MTMHCSSTFWSPSNKYEGGLTILTCCPDDSVQQMIYIQASIQLVQAGGEGVGIYHAINIRIEGRIYKSSNIRIGGGGHGGLGFYILHLHAHTQFTLLCLTNMH